MRIQQGPEAHPEAARIANNASGTETDVAGYNTCLPVRRAANPVVAGPSFNPTCPMPHSHSTLILGGWSSPTTTPS